MFLEVHIQNLTPEPLHLERIDFECTNGWNATDVNVLPSDNHERLFSGSQAPIQPQDIRQYTYILTPNSASSTPTIYPPGSTIPLGRLDILWRSLFGEFGRLLTSMLSRRIPLLAPVPQPVPTLPFHIKRAITASLPSRPQSPQFSQSRPGTPPSNRPTSPSQSRSSLVGAVGPAPQPLSSPRVSDIEVSLVKRAPTPTSAQLQKPFRVPFSLSLSAPVHPEKKHHRRVVRLVVQHLQHRRTSQSAPALAPSTTLTSQLSSGFSTPSQHPTFSDALANQRTSTSSPPQNYRDEPSDLVTLPPPFFSDTDESNPPSTGVFTGSSALFLPSVELCTSETEMCSDPTEGVGKLHASQDFELLYLPRQKGYMATGGLRVLLVRDSFTDAVRDSVYDGDTESISLCVILKEWDVVAEVWVAS